MIENNANLTDNYLKSQSLIKLLKCDIFVVDGSTGFVNGMRLNSVANAH